MHCFAQVEVCTSADLTRLIETGVKLQRLRCKKNELRCSWLTQDCIHLGEIHYRLDWKDFWPLVNRCMRLSMLNSKSAQTPLS